MRTRLILIGVFLLSSWAHAQDRDTKVRNDRKAFEGSKDWIYNDLGEGVRAATTANKPLLVVFRCVPCVACQEFDDDVARRDPVIRDLLDEFVCVRIVQANTIDLTRFQHDFDQSFAAYLMNPDLTIYGRFATRSERPEHDDISLEGMRKSMVAALAMHRNYPAIKTSLAGKQVTQAKFKTPRDYPSLSGKYGETIDYQEKTAKSCMHCHQIREAERQVYRAEKQPLPDEVLFPYPDPAVLGLKMDPKAMATVERVAPGTPAERAGLRVGDEIATLAGQPLLSIADLQWVLQNTPSATRLAAQIRREGQPMDLAIDLPEGWRRGDISWRATTWDLRRMGFGGMKLVPLDAKGREAAHLADSAMALRVEHVGEYGEHARAKKAGFRKADIIVAFDGISEARTESNLLAHCLQTRRPGDEISVTVLRNGRRETMKYTLP